jgi:hypothetical protein
MVAFAPPGDYGLSGWAIGHPLAVAMNQSGPGAARWVRLLCSVSEFRLSNLQTAKAIGPHLRALGGPETRKLLEPSGCNRSAGLSVSARSRLGLSPPLG